MDLPKYPHCAIICGQTGCGKTEFVLDLLESEYKGFFEYIVILCPTIQWNKVYRRNWLFGPEKKQKRNNSKPHQQKRRGSAARFVKTFFFKYQGYDTLYIIDDCSATKELTKKKDMLSQLVFSGRHANQSVWVISQRYNSVLKDLREQTKWLCVFYMKDRDPFSDCLKENDVIPPGERQKIKEELSAVKHRKLIYSLGFICVFVSSCVCGHVSVL